MFFESNKFNVRRLLDSKVVKNIFVLATGAMSVQVINLALIPLLTRLFSSDMFGLLGLFSLALNLLVVVVGLCYPLAVVLARTDKVMTYIVSVSIKLTFIVGTILGFLSLLVAMSFDVFFDEVIGYLLLGMFPAAMSAIYAQIFIRQHRYRDIALIGFVSALVAAVVKLLSGYYYPSSAALILSVLVGVYTNFLYSHFVLFGRTFPIASLKINRFERAVMRKYKQLPYYRLPHSFNVALSQLIPVILLTEYFGLQAAGFFVLTRSVLIVPVNILGKSVYDVAYPKLSSEFNVKPMLPFLMVSTALLLALTIIPMLALFFYGEWIFAFVFGEEWGRAGLYAGCMAVWFAFNFSNRACVAAVSLLKLDGFLLFNGVVNLVLSVIGFLVSFYVWGTDTASIGAFYLCALIAQVFLVFRVLLVANQHDKRLMKKEVA